MINRALRLVVIAASLLGDGTFPASAQPALSEGERLARLETKVSRMEDEHIRPLEVKVSNLDRKIEHAGNIGLIVFLFGAFCALWAQNTGRNSVLWFVLGVFFNVITVVVLLSKNSNDNLRKMPFG